MQEFIKFFSNMHVCLHVTEKYKIVQLFHCERALKDKSLCTYAYVCVTEENLKSPKK